MLSFIFPNFRKFITSVTDHVSNTKITKTLQIWFFMYIQDFGITAEWNFCATSRWKNLCNRVGGSVKCLATRASLQRPLDNQILTSYQLFEFASQNVSGITFYVDLYTFKKTAAILEPWFAKTEHIKGTRNHHQFVPEGSSIRMIRISGSTTNVDSHIVDTNRMDLNDITPGSFYAWKYCCISVLPIMFPWNLVMLMWNSCNPRHLLRSFFGLIGKISVSLWIPLNHMICRVEPPSSVSTALFCSFDKASIYQLLGYL